MAVYSTQRAEAKKKNDEIYDKQVEQVKNTFDAGVKDIVTAYDDQQRAVAVQKLINERKVAESVANLGLTDSGLNRTQQTAVQLSAANAAYNLNRQKQSDLNKYQLERDNKISTIEQNRIASAADVDATYDGLEAEYKAAQAKAAASAQKEASYIIRTNNGLLDSTYTGTLKSVGVDCYEITKNGETYIRYVDNNSGKVSELPKGVSPYTGTKNPDIDNGGAFDNGYQPNNIKGDKLRAARTSDGKIATYTVNGLEYRIHTVNGKFYRWDRASNAYIELTGVSGLY